MSTDHDNIHLMPLVDYMDSDSDNLMNDSIDDNDSIEVVSDVSEK